MLTQIIYNESTVLELNVGQVATIVCSGMRMSSNVEILFADDGYVIYDGTEIDASSGQRVVLHCAGSKLNSDIVVRVPYTIYESLITVDGLMYTTAEEHIFKVLES